MASPRHKLSEIDTYELYAFCDQCDGYVPITSTGIKNRKEYWRCSNRKQETVKRFLYGDVGVEAWKNRTGCELCGATENLHIDHCAVTNTFRGILCIKHNTGLGKFNHDPAMLRKAAEYLERKEG